MDVYTNAKGRPPVLKPFLDLLQASPESSLAAPYFTRWREICDSAKAGRKIELLIGLNTATSVEAVLKAIEEPNITVRYLTGRFHAKIYIFGESDALLGSSNLTDNGLAGNREATIHLTMETDQDRLLEIQALFEDLWASAEPLTVEVARRFRIAMATVPPFAEQDKKIIDAVGKVEPVSIHEGSGKKTSRQKHASALRKRVYEQYRPYFSQVSRVLQDTGSRRPSLSMLSLENETNRFLNWVKLTYVKGEDWEEAELRDGDDLRQNIERLAREWRGVEKDMVDQSYVDRLAVVEAAFETPERIKDESKDELTRGLSALHAFSEQMRFKKAGQIEAAFWKANNQDEVRVRRSLTHLLHGSGDFIVRLHDLLYNPHYELANFKIYCALELYGTVKPKELPPVNGRIAKGLRFLGFDVKAG